MIMFIKVLFGIFLWLVTVGGIFAVSLKVNENLGKDGYKQMAHSKIAYGALLGASLFWAVMASILL